MSAAPVPSSWQSLLYTQNTNGRLEVDKHWRPAKPSYVQNSGLCSQPGHWSIKSPAIGSADDPALALPVGSTSCVRALIPNAQSSFSTLLCRSLPLTPSTTVRIYLLSSDALSRLR